MEERAFGYVPHTEILAMKESLQIIQPRCQKMCPLPLNTLFFSLNSGGWSMLRGEVDNTAKQTKPRALTILPCWFH